MRLLVAGSEDDVRDVLREGLDAAGKTQADLARHLGFSAKHMSFMMTGRAQISIPHLFAIMEYLGIQMVLSRPE